MFPVFVDLTKAEPKNLFYEFSVNGDEVFCREGYTDAEGLLAHLDNVSAPLAQAMKIADLTAQLNAATLTVVILSSRVGSRSRAAST